jgi:uncharacterized protein YdhG (YjbR/CyaY superfamily)
MKQNNTDSPAPATIDAYIADFPPEIQEKLQQMRAAIREVAPDTQEAIKYGIPTFIYKGSNLVHFGGFTRRIGFYPAPRTLEAFRKTLAEYPGAKGSVQFAHSQPLPLALVQDMVRFRLREADEKKPRKRNQR